MALPRPEPLGLTVPETGYRARGEEGVAHQGALPMSLAPTPAPHSAAPAPLIQQLEVLSGECLFFLRGRQGLG